MRYEILTNYFGQHVEVGIINKIFSGILRQAESDGGLNDIVEIEPGNDYARKRYGSAILDVNTITSIRAIKPHTDEDDDCCEDSP